MPPIRVLLVDDSAVMRSTLRTMLAPIQGLQIIEEVQNGRAAVQIITEQQPDIVLMDIEMPIMNGLDAVQAIKAFPQVRTIMVSLRAEEEYVAHALRAGAIGYILKETLTVDLVPAMQAAIRGEYYFSAAILHAIINAFVQHLSV